MEKKLRARMIGLTTATLGLSTASTSLASLSQRAVRLRESWGVPPPDSSTAHRFDSAYTCGGTEAPRGWCNWLIPGRLMLGQYPAEQPSPPGPTSAEAAAHLQRVLDAGVDAFACLQAEVPPQEVASRWPAGGVPLGGSSGERFPGAFQPYAPVANRLAAAAGRAPPTYLHHGIEDLSVPGDAARLRRLLDALLTHYEGGGAAIYVHCWGGRGRAGLVGSALCALMWPSLGGEVVLESVQRGYDSRAGAEAMPAALRRSPQTDSQRDFVRRFARAVCAESGAEEVSTYG